MAEVLYAEQGASWWTLLFPVVFAGVGIGVEALGGPVYWTLWLGAGGLLLLFTALWVYARRKFAVVRVTRDELTQGSETLATAGIAKVFDGDDEPLGVRVLGGGQAVPRKHQAVRLQLADGRRVLAWARDGDALRTALREATGA